MAIGIGGDAHHQMRDLAGVPFDAIDKLQHHHAIAAHQPLVLAQTVGNGDTGTQVGVGHGLAGDHALVVTGRDTTRRDQQLPGLANGVVLAGGAGVDAHHLAQGSVHSKGSGMFVRHISQASPWRLCVVA